MKKKEEARPEIKFNFFERFLLIITFGVLKIFMRVFKVAGFLLVVGFLVFMIVIVGSFLIVLIM